jgi:hypothetical protein
VAVEYPRHPVVKYLVEMMNHIAKRPVSIHGKDVLISLCSKMGMYGQKGKMLHIFLFRNIEIEYYDSRLVCSIFIFGMG